MHTAEVARTAGGGVGSTCASYMLGPSSGSSVISNDEFSDISNGEFSEAWSLGNLNLVDYFPTGSQAFYHEIVIQSENLPERSEVAFYIYSFTCWRKKGGENLIYI